MAVGSQRQAIQQPTEQRSRQRQAETPNRARLPHQPLETSATDRLQQLVALANNSPRTAQLRSLQELANNSPRATELRQLQALATSPKQSKEPEPAATPQIAKPTPNRTGLPDALKSGIEALSGLSMDQVRVHYNSAQPARLNALAYAQGSDIHLAPGQERHLPHEAWHVVQQAQGRVRSTLDVGGRPINVNPGLEREADVMGARASSPGSITTTRAPTKTGVSASIVVQCYFQQNYVEQDCSQSSWLQADDCSVAVKKDYPNHELYAKEKKAATANLELEAVSSGIRLTETNATNMFAYWRDSQLEWVTLKKIEAQNKENNTQGDNMLLYADCGYSNAVVVGSNDRQAVYTKPDGGVTKAKAPGDPWTMKTAIMKAWLDAAPTGDIDIIRTKISGQLLEMQLSAILNEYHLATTDVEKEEVQIRYSAKLDEIAEAYWKHYNGLAPDARNKIDKALKINRYADPGVGQGFTTSSGGPSAGKSTWNFHWGGVVMTSDDNKDKVVLENYAVGDPAAVNKLWTFDLYGSEKDQTFHERHSATKQHGMTPTTMTIEKEP